MKKIILSIFIICGLHLPALAATYNCQVQEISNFSFKRSNEFLFPTYGDYNDANGRALVCGHRGTNGCDSGAMVLINGEHYWRNRRYEGMNVYVCSTGGANAWASNNKDYIQVCSNTSGKTKVGTDGRFDYYCTNVVNSYVNNWYCVGQNGTDICRVAVDTTPTLTPAPTPTPTPTPTPAPAPTPTPAPTPAPSCEQTRCSALNGSIKNECIACCNVPASVAVWRNYQCICIDNDQTFISDDNPRNGGVCINIDLPTPTPAPEPEPDPEPAYICDPAIMAQLTTTLQIQYASNTTISGKILAIIQYCEGKPNENTFIAMYNQLLALINQENAAAQLTQQQNASRRRIEGAISDIESIVSTLDRSKWKNAEGGFNTSRLLSDSIAGVVLGTAGGLITSHVVKKNQVEGGFEDIQCTVGGQVVSGWGDEFQVGIQ